MRETRPQSLIPHRNLRRTINLNVHSELANGRLWVPIAYKDIVRDLLANARKYTKPGGIITLDLHQDSDALVCKIEDSGYGIPESEISEVVKFGYRATNTRNLRTLGGGFGLTKASWLILGWGGKLHISSEVNVGTRISFTVPNKTIPHNA